MSAKAMVDIPEHIRPGSKFLIGSYRFEIDEIVHFARSWDPQPFHTDPERARDSLFGGLCASGWHTVSVWMKLQRMALSKSAQELKEAGKTAPVFGPSPGIKHLRWIKPVFADDTIRYYNEIIDLRPTRSKPGWHIMKSKVLAKNQDGEPVMTFDSAVLLQV